MVYKIFFFSFEDRGKKKERKRLVFPDVNSLSSRTVISYVLTAAGCGYIRVRDASRARVVPGRRQECARVL